MCIVFINLCSFIARLTSVHEDICISPATKTVYNNHFFYFCVCVCIVLNYTKTSKFTIIERFPFDMLHVYHHHFTLMNILFPFCMRFSKQRNLLRIFKDCVFIIFGLINYINHIFSVFYRYM